jgi:hypothetical protein
VPIFSKDGRHILFAHIPKTGGSTIERVFKASGYKTVYLDGRVGRGTVNHVRKCTPQHMHAEMLQTILKPENFDLIFMMVREPEARFKSEYLWRNRKGTPAIDARSVTAWGDKAFKRYTSDPFMFDNHLRPQAEFKLPGSTVYRFEDGMQSVVDALNSQHGLGLSSEIPRIREGHQVTGFSSRDVEVSPEMARAVKQFYSEDYRSFGYPL